MYLDNVSLLVSLDTDFSSLFLDVPSLYYFYIVLRIIFGSGSVAVKSYLSTSSIEIWDLYLLSFDFGIQIVKLSDCLCNFGSSVYVL
jgi:hypothetical protein